MDLTPWVPRDRQLIDRCLPGGFQVRGVAWVGALLVFPDYAESWTAPPLEQLALAHLQPVLDAVPRPDVLLLGCGPKGCRLPRLLRDGLRGAGIGVEAMDTSAACRTYNVLAAEGRRVVAALLPL